MTSRPFYPATHPSPHAVGGGGYPTQQQSQPQFSSFHQHPQQQQQQNELPTPSSQQQPRASGSGLIRLTLRKPMGIVFEPLPPTPGQTQKGSGVRICDLPRTGAAYMSGRLEVGDELLSINDVTMSRLTFDQIMDFIINADPEGLRILFRRPKKEDIHGTLGVAPSQSMTDNNENSNTMNNQRTSAVQWGQNEVVHEEVVKPARQSRKKKVKSPRPSSEPATSRRDRDRHGGRSSSTRRAPSLEEDDDDDMTDMEDDENTLMSEDPSVMDQRKNSRKSDKKNGKAANGRSSKNGRNNVGNRSPKEKLKVEESFLDLLINNICQVTAGKGMKKDDFSDDGISYADTNTVGDEDTYADGDESTYGDDPSIYSTDEIAKKGKSNNSNKNQKGKSLSNKKNKHDYEDDYTLETTDSPDRLKASGEDDEDDSRFQEDDYEENVPLGLAPQRKSKKKSKKQAPHLQMPAVLQGKNPSRMILHEQPFHNQNQHHNPTPLSQSYDHDAKLPFRELEYNQHEADGGDVSVLTNNMSQYGSHISPQALVYAHSYTQEPGKTLEESIETNPERFYKHVVSEILSQNEPEKVRLLDKLLAKYQGREEHLIQKLTVRYRSGKHVTNEASPLSQDPFQEQQQQTFQNPHEAAQGQGQGLDPNNQDVDPWNTGPNGGAGMGMGINDDFAMPPPSQGNFFQPSLQVETAPPPPPPTSQPGAPVSTYQTLGSVGTTDDQSPMSAAFPEDSTGNIRLGDVPPDFSHTGQPVPPPPPPGRSSFDHAPHDQFVAEGDPNVGFFDGQQQQQPQEEEVYYDDEPDQEEQGHFEDMPQENEFASTSQEQQQQFQSEASPVYATATENPPSPSRRSSFSPQGGGSGGEEAFAQDDFGHQQDEYVDEQEEDEYQQQQQQDSSNNLPLEIHPSRSRSPHPGASPPRGQAQGQQLGVGDGYADQEEEYSEVDNETEGEDSAYTSDYSDSQGMDGTSPAVIAQVSELLNFVYGKTSVTGQIDRVSTIMRAYEGRENVLLELLETKALIKANQADEPPPQGLIASSSASHDHSVGSYGDEEGMEEHPDDISSVSGDDSRFNVKVPLADSESSAIVSPMTHTSIEMDTLHFARDRTQQHQHQQNNHQFHQNNNQNGAQQNYQQGSRPKQPPQKMGQENRGGRQANQNNGGGANARATAAPAAQQQEKKKKGMFGGLFKGKKNKNGKKDSASNITPPKNNTTRGGGFSGFSDQEQEV
jgi:hypothetical protein